MNNGISLIVCLISSQATGWTANRAFKIAIVGVAGGLDARGVLKTLGAHTAEHAEKHSSQCEIPIPCFVLIVENPPICYSA